MYQFETMVFGVNISTDGLQESFLSFLRPSQGLTGSYTGFFPWKLQSGCTNSCLGIKGGGAFYKGTVCLATLLLCHVPMFCQFAGLAVSPKP